MEEWTAANYVTEPFSFPVSSFERAPIRVINYSLISSMKKNTKIIGTSKNPGMEEVSLAGMGSSRNISSSNCNSALRLGLRDPATRLRFYLFLCLLDSPFFPPPTREPIIGSHANSATHSSNLNSTFPRVPYR